MPAVSQVQRGAVAIAAGDGTTIDVTITSVDTSRAIVMFTERNGDIEIRQQRHNFGAYFTSATNLRFLRYEASSARSVDIEWTVVEFDTGALASLQTGIRASAADPDDISITAVDPAAAFPILSFETDLLTFGNNALPRPLIVQTTVPGDTLRLDFNLTPGTNDRTSYWQIVEFDSADASVQSGVIDCSSAYGGTATITSVDTAKTLIAGFGYGSSSGQRGHPRIYLSSATQVAADTQAYGTSISWDAAWYAIEMLDASVVEAGTATLADTATAPATAPSWATAMTDGAVFAARPQPNAYVNASNDNCKPDDVFFSVALDSPQDGVTITRTGTTNDIELAWQVVEWGGSAGPATSTGTLDASESGTDTAAITGAVLVDGALAATESGADVAALAGTVLIDGALAATESGADVAALAGDVLVSGAMAAQEAGSDTAAATGSVLVAGALAATEAGADTVAATGAVLVTGAMAATESGADTLSIIGEGVAASATGTLAAQESGADSFAGTGTVRVAGALAVVESGADSCDASGTVRVLGSFDILESGHDTLSGAGQIRISGSLAAIETGSDTASFTRQQAVVQAAPRKANFSWKEYVERMDGKARAKPDTAYEFSNGRKFEDRG